MAYITSGSRLLVFDHVDYPEAGTQVPAGTIKPGEAPEQAVLREAWEETGLAGLTMARFLGEQDFDARPYRDEIHRRYFFHLLPGQDVPEVWIHHELHEGLAPPTAFRLYWVSLAAVPPLAGEQDQLLSAL